MQEHQDSAQKHIRSWPLLGKREFSFFSLSPPKRQFTIIVCFSSHVGEMKGGGGGNLRKREEEEGRYDDVDEQYRRPASLPLCIWVVCLCVLKTGPATGGEKFLGKQSCHTILFRCCESIV